MNENFMMPTEQDRSEVSQAFFNNSWALPMFLMMLFPSFSLEDSTKPLDANKLIKAMIVTSPEERKKLFEECLEDMKEDFRISYEKMLKDMMDALQTTTFYEQASQETKDALVKAIDEGNQEEIKKYLDKLTEEMKESNYGN